MKKRTETPGRMMSAPYDSEDLRKGLIMLFEEERESTQEKCLLLSAVIASLLIDEADEYNISAEMLRGRIDIISNQIRHFVDKKEDYYECIKNI